MVSQVTLLIRVLYFQEINYTSILNFLTNLPNYATNFFLVMELIGL